MHPPSCTRLQNLQKRRITSILRFWAISIEGMSGSPHELGNAPSHGSWQAAKEWSVIRMRTDLALKIECFGFTARQYESKTRRNTHWFERSMVPFRREMRVFDALGLNSLIGNALVPMVITFALPLLLLHSQSFGLEMHAFAQFWLHFGRKCKRFRYFRIACVGL